MTAVAFTFAALLGSGPLLASQEPATAQDHCATPEQMEQIREFFADNPGVLPAIAVRTLRLPEAVIASGLPESQAASAPQEGFAQVWDSLTTWSDASTMIMKGGNVIEVKGPIPPGRPSSRSDYFNLSDRKGAGLSGHLRPDLLSSIYAVVVPGDAGGTFRGVLFFDASGDSAFSVFLPQRPRPRDVEKFDATMALIRSMPSVCGGS